MKNFKNRISIFIALLFFGIACNDEVRIPDFEDGPNVRIVLDANSAAINYFSDLSQAKVKFDLYTEGHNIQTVDIRVQRNGAGTPVSIISFTQDSFDSNGGIIKGVELTLPDIAAKLNLAGGVAGFKGADQLKFFNFTTLTNGVVYPSTTVNGQLNLSPTVQQASATTSFTSNFNVALVCPSSIPEGSYTASQPNPDDWFGSATTKQVTITKVAGSANQYLISDVSAGGYAFCCLGFGYNADQPAIISDVCLGITVTGASTSQIKSGQGVSAGSWDPATKTLIVHYDDTFNGSKAGGTDLVSTFVKN
jgi:hypothetical protein